MFLIRDLKKAAKKRIFETAKNIECKSEEQLKAIKVQGEKQLRAIKDQSNIGVTLLKSIYTKEI